MFLLARDETGADVGGAELVLHRTPTGWTVFSGPGTGALGCEVPKAVATDLEVSAPPNCSKQFALPGYVDCGYGPAKTKPSQLMIACGDGSFFITNLKWARWNRAKAQSVGVGHLNDCIPYCAEGHYHTFSIAVDLSRPQTCGKNGVLQFTRLKWIAVRQRPKGAPRSETFSAECPLP